MISKSLILASSFTIALSFSGHVSSNTLESLSSDSSDCLSFDFLNKSDAQFASDCAETVFAKNSTVADRQSVAWLLFARANQLVEGVDGDGDTVVVPKWMAWPTDADTFKTPTSRFIFKEVPDVSSSDIFVIPKHVLAGGTSTLHPDGSNEQVTRNDVAYDYLFDNQLNTKEGLHTYLAQETVHRLEMPIGSIEIKGSWLLSQPDYDPHFPDDTFSFVFLDDKNKPARYWFRGMHIMAKFATLGDEEDVFSSENPSWFWTTFELNKNPGGAACTDEHNPKLPPCTTEALNPTGTEHVRAELISQLAPLKPELVVNFLRNSGIGGMGFENYAPNGTQIRFTLDADGKTPVILGHTDMEDFAGWINGVNSPNTHQNPAQWDKFDASCHTCHATAAYNPKTRYAYPFTVHTGKLPEGYTNGCYVDGQGKKDKNGFNYYANLSDGYKSLDFMWPIAFWLGLHCSVSKLTG